MKAAKCLIKTDLLAKYREATDAYAASVAVMSKRIGVSSKQEYDNLNLATQKARRSSAKALEAIEAHTDEHGC
jgi:hypothetical protein